MKIKRSNIFSLVLFSTLMLLMPSLFAQEASKATTGSSAGESWLTSGIILIIVLSIMIFIILVVLYMIFALKVFLREVSGKDKTVQSKPIIDFTNAVPIEREHEIMMDHDYDGIRELDNNLPPWWVYMFYATIAFGVFYIWFYHFGGSGELQDKEYEMEIAQAETQMKLAASRVDENSVTLVKDAARIKKGEELYITNCAACHGKQGEGKVGPNLTDEFWIHGGDIKSIFKTVKYGIPEKGMISWQAQLGPSQIQDVSSYIKTLKGTNPANPKAPQGDKYTE